MKLEGQATIITGGGSGLGAETAECLARAGARVAVLDVNIKSAASCAEKIGGLGLECDVADADSVAAAFARAHELLGPPRIVLSCAGIARAKQIMTQSVRPAREAFDRILSVNLSGNFNVMRHAATAMARLDPLPDRERGIIISGAAVTPCETLSRGHGAHITAGQETLSLGHPPLREMRSNGIRVVTLAPGAALNQFLQNLPDAPYRQWSPSLPAIKQADPTASLAAFIAHFIENVSLVQDALRIDAEIAMRRSVAS